MRRLFLPFFAVSALLFPAIAGSYNCPTVGRYSTQDGSMLPGRASEAWCPPTVYPGVPGNTENAESWDGAYLGTEWKLWGMTIDETGAVETGRDMDADGNGWITYTTHYEGGQFWLSKDGDWGDGVSDYTGTMTNYTVITTVTYVAGELVGATSNVTATGVFDDCRLRDAVVKFVIANAMLAWHPSWASPPPPDYPELLCGAPTGELFDVCCITMEIASAVPAVDRSWGVVKSMYR